MNFTNQNFDILQHIAVLEFSISQNLVWQKTVDQLKQGHKLLEKQQFRAPEDYLSIDLLDGIWTSYKQIYHQKINLFEKDRIKLQDRVIEDEKHVKLTIRDLQEKWAKLKLQFTDMDPD